MPGLRKRLLSAAMSGAVSNEIGGVVGGLKTLVTDTVRERKTSIDRHTRNWDGSSRREDRFPLLREILKRPPNTVSREQSVERVSQDGERSEIGDEDMFAGHSRKYRTMMEGKRRPKSKRAKVL